VTDFIISSNPGYFTTTVAKIDEKVRKLPAKDPLNIYMKKYGNMEQCLKQPGTSSVINIEGNTVKFNNNDEVTEAHSNKVLSDAAYA